MKYEPKQVSASQLRLFQRDVQAWRAKYLHGHREEPTAAMLAGKLFHAGMEAGLKGEDVSGLSPRIQHAVEATKAFIDCGDVWEFEDHVEFDIEGTRVVTGGQGYIDAWTSDVPAKRATVVDHKTLASADKAKTEHELRQDIQMMLYAYVATAPGWTAELVHNYVLRNGPHRCWQVRTVVTYDEAQAYFDDNIMPLVHAIDDEWVQWFNRKEEEEVKDTEQTTFLFVGTWPTKWEGEPPVLLHDWLADEMDTVTEEQCRLWCAVDFSAGPGYVLDKARENGKLDDPPPVLFLPYGDKLSELAAGHLSGTYDVVIGRVY
jgi:hypothetical protein